MNNISIKKLNIKEGLVTDDDPVWQNLLNNPRINELFEGIEQAERDIKNGDNGKDFDEFFEEFNKEHFNGMLFQASNSWCIFANSLNYYLYYYEQSYYSFLGRIVRQAYASMNILKTFPYIYPIFYRRNKKEYRKIIINNYFIIV